MGTLTRSGACERRAAALAGGGEWFLFLGPDATALGQVYWYTVEGKGFDLAELRSVQDWFIRYQVQSVEGVSEVASIGGFVKQYQIDLHPDKMRDGKGGGRHATDGYSGCGRHDRFTDNAFYRPLPVFGH